MKISSIQFDNPILRECEYFENKSDSIQKQDLSLKIGIENKYNKDDTNRLATVIFTVVAGEKSDNFPFYIRVVYSANFKWDDSISNPDEYLKINAPTLLYGYARPTISEMISKTRFGRLDLPFVDFSAMKDNKAEINLQ